MCTLYLLTILVEGDVYSIHINSIGGGELCTLYILTLLVGGDVYSIHINSIGGGRCVLYTY